jgi:broad specificity phosphatase PhoE
MTTFLLLRHAHSTANDAGLLAGRMEGVGLSKTGRQQVRSLVSAFNKQSFDRIISSPLPRCLETIEGIASNHRKRVHLDERFLEMDYGLWSGRKLKELAKEKSWKTIQTRPLSFTFPKGESFAHAALRVERGLKSLARQYPNETIVIVSHGDIIKLALQITHGGSLGNFQSFVVDTCSLSEINWSTKSRTIVRTNARIVKRSDVKPRTNKIKERRIIGGGAGV